MAGQTPQSEQVYSVYTEGQKAGLTPHLGFDPAIGSPCKHGIFGIISNFCQARMKHLILKVLMCDCDMHYAVAIDSKFLIIAFESIDPDKQTNPSRANSL